MRRALHTKFLSLVFIMLCSGWLVISAQQDAGKQQRPRRVTPTTTQKPAPAATPDKSKPSAQDGEEIDEGDVVRVDTQLVSVPAVVTNRAGRPVANLRAENFVVYENGSKQQIVNFGTTDAPFEIALLLDTSGSTRAEVALIRRAANAFIDALRAGDRVSIIAFKTAREEGTSLATVDVTTALTSDRDALRKAVESVSTSNGTPYYDALERIADEVFREPPDEEVRGRRAVVALTDGVDSASLAEFEEARDKLLKAGIASYFIQVNTEDYVENRLMSDCRYDGALRLSRTQLQRYRRIFVPNGDAEDYANFCQLGPFERMQISRNLYSLARKEMNELARASGGKTFPAADLVDARKAFAQVAQEIGTQYSLGYYPSNTSRDGSFRQIRVEVKGVEAGTQVRAREGYTAPKG
jgi:Ca-activated chloride channel family protein